MNVWNDQYEISLDNAGGNGNIPARYQDRYQNVNEKLMSFMEWIMRQSW